jgi:site-specific recombinase XerD
MEDKNLPPAIVKLGVPEIIANTGERGAYKFLEYFISSLENDNTRIAYYRAVCSFLSWCEERNVNVLVNIQSVHIALYLKDLKKRVSVQTRKQHLAAVRKCFDWLVVNHVLPINPATVVAGPKHVVSVGKTPVLMGDEARKILDG